MGFFHQCGPIESFEHFIPIFMAVAHFTSAGFPVMSKRILAYQTLFTYRGGRHHRCRPGVRQHRETTARKGLTTGH